MREEDILYPLRRIHGFLHETRKQYQKKIKFALYLLFPVGKKVLLPGTPEHQNMGDSAIVIAQRNFLKKCGISNNRIKEVSFSEYRKYCKLLKRLVDKNVLITQLGGGNMGNQWLEEEKLHRDILIDFSDNTQIIFPQTIFYTATDCGEQEKRESVKYYNGCKKVTLFARENSSYKSMQELYPNASVSLAPDIVLSSTQEEFGVKKQKRDKILLCLRNDVEKSLTVKEHILVESYLKSHKYSFKVTDMYSECTVTKENRNDCVKRKMEEFASARLVITDRLHGMVFAAITGTPCIVFGNYNHKVKGTYEWIEYLQYIQFVDSVEEMERIFPELISMGNCKFNPTPLVPHFEKLAELVKSYAIN